jgi:hypothetical protein
MFEELDRRPALSPGTFGTAVVLTLSALFMIAHGLWQWVGSKAAPLSLLWGASGALAAWLAVQSERDWSEASRRRLIIAAVMLMTFFGLTTVYGTYIWYRYAGDPLLPTWSAAYLILGILSLWRSQRLSHGG